MTSSMSLTASARASADTDVTKVVRAVFAPTTRPVTERITTLAKMPLGFFFGK